MGSGCASNNAYSFSIGNGSIGDTNSKFTFGCSTGTQGGLLTLVSNTTDATPTVMTTGGSASSSNQLFLRTFKTVAFRGTVVAQQSGAQGNLRGVWEFTGGRIHQGSSMASTTLDVSPAITAIGTPPSGWGIAFSADTTHGCLAITFTGQAGVTIKASAELITTEVQLS